MAKELKAKFIIDISDVGQKLDAVERRFNKTRREIEKDSGMSMGSIREGLLGARDKRGRFTGESQRDISVRRQEYLAGAMQQKPTFDAQIGGGMYGNERSKFSKEVAASGSGFVELAAKAWVAKKAVEDVFVLGAAAADVFKGKVKEAQDRLEAMPFTGDINKIGRGAGEWFSDTFVDRDVYANRDKAEGQNTESDKKIAQAKRDMASNRRREEFSAQTRGMLFDAGSSGTTDPYQKELMRIKRFEEEATRTLEQSGLAKNSNEYKGRSDAISANVAAMKYRATGGQAQEQARAQGEINQKQAQLDNRKLQGELAGIKAGYDAKRATASAGMISYYNTMQEMDERFAKQNDAKARAKEIEQANAEINAGQLKATGKSLEADLVLRDQYWKERIKQAQDEGKTELAAKLGMQRNIDFIDIAVAHMKAPSQNTVSPLVSSYLTRVPGGNDPQNKLVSLAEKQILATRDVTKAVKAIKSTTGATVADITP